MQFKQFLKKLLTKISPVYRLLLTVEQRLKLMEDQQGRIQTKLDMLDSLTGFADSADSYHRDLAYRLDHYYGRLLEHQKSVQQLSMNSFWMLNPVARNIKEIQRDFWKSFPHAEGDLAVIQSCNLWLMQELKKICDTNGLHFWLHGGTLIGAVRHHGFIPWDDDVDVGMLRGDLEKLIRITENSEFKVFVYYHDDETFSRGYQFKLADESLPVFIDIFAFDFSSCANEQQMNDMQLRYNEIRSQMIESFLNLSDPIRVLDVGYQRYGPLNSADLIIAETLINEHMAKLGDSKKGNCLYYGIDNYPFPYKIMKQESIFPTQTMLFEGLMYEVPRNYDKYLEAYGDYWQMPNNFGEVSSHAYWYEPHIEKMRNFLSRIELKEI